MKHRQLYFFLFSLFFLYGCDKYYLSVKREPVDINQLASTFVGSPDPRQKNPPIGQELTMEWRLPTEAMDQSLFLELHILYRNYVRETFTYPVDRRRGIVVYSLLNKEYYEKEGLLTYKAQIVDSNGKVIKEWKQILWTDLIVLEEPDVDLN